MAISEGALSDATITGEETTVAQTDVVQFVVAWESGQASNGDIAIEAWLNNETGWFVLEFGATISLDGASGNHQLIIQQVSFKKVRPVYTRTNGSATGTLNVAIFATSKGA